MSEEVEDVAKIIERVAEVATLAGIKGKVSEDGRTYITGFGFNDGRSQMVIVRAIRTPQGPGICVFSAAARYKKGFFGKLSRDDAIELLRRNDNLCFARYGIRETDSEIMVVASVDLILETMDPEELEAALGSVAGAADSWEERTGKDDF
jgi:hypothetical protein